MEESFRFEHELKLSVQDYIKIMKTPLSTDKKIHLKKLRLLLLIIPAILLFFSKYTIVIGILLVIAILTIVILQIFTPSILQSGLRSTYYGHKVLQNTLKYVIDEKGFKVEGEYINACCDWNLLSVWKIRGDWLILSPSGLMQLYFQISQLKKAGIYKKIEKKLENYGVQYNSKKAQKSMAREFKP